MEKVLTQDRTLDRRPLHQGAGFSNHLLGLFVVSMQVYQA